MKCDDEIHQAAVGRLAVIEAERKLALDALDDLEKMITRVGGFLTHPDQETLSHARYVLVQTNHRKSDAPPTWQDRKCTCTKHPKLEGANAWIRDHKCPIESHRAAVTTRPKGG